MSSLAEMTLVVERVSWRLVPAFKYRTSTDILELGLIWSLNADVLITT